MCTVPSGGQSHAKERKSRTIQRSQQWITEDLRLLSSLSEVHN